jgi:FkbM family methyltransferase
MSLKRKFINILDNGIGRGILGRLATMKARQMLQADVQIGFDDVWYHRMGSYFVPDRPRFDYYEPTILMWKDEIPTYFQDATDFWFGSYKPMAGHVIVDIGAGRGEDTLPFASEVGIMGRVIAVEAHPPTYGHLKRFCLLNQLNNVTTLNAAVMDTSGTVIIEDGESWEKNTISSTGAGMRVKATTVDEICRKARVGHIDFLKMNIEGAETQALLGMNEMIGKIKTICVCCHDFRAERGDGEHYRTRDFVIEFLTDKGFLVTRRSSDLRDYVRDHVFGSRS